jgi:hypothetical protein
MNANTELELTRTNPNKITISLQGHLFVLPADHVLCHDWLVKTIVQTDVGKDAIRDAIYLDCEPDSFLLIYKILNNLYDIENLSKLSEIALQLLVSSCKYMNCNYVATIIEEQIDTKHFEAEAARKEKASLLQQLELAKKENASLLQHLDARDLSFLNEKWMPVYNCVCKNGRVRETSSFSNQNLCNNPAIIFGDVSIDKIECAHCKKPMKINRMKPDSGVVKKLRGASSHYQMHYEEPLR